VNQGIINAHALAADTLLAAVGKFLEEGGDQARRQLVHVYLECVSLDRQDGGDQRGSAEQWLLWFAGYGLGPEPQPDELRVGDRVLHRLTGQRGVVTEAKPLTVRYTGDHADQHALAVPEPWELTLDDSIAARRGREAGALR